jgi:hypothetical protein
MGFDDWANFWLKTSLERIGSDSGVAVILWARLNLLGGFKLEIPHTQFGKAIQI